MFRRDKTRFCMRLDSINRMLAYSIGQSSIPVPYPIVQLQVAASIGDQVVPTRAWPSVSLYEEASIL